METKREQQVEEREELLPSEDVRNESAGSDEATAATAMIAEERARLASALQNLEAAKARVERDAKIVHEETRRDLVAKMLPVLDDFDRAIAAAASAGEAAAILDGVRMIRHHLETVLRGYGLERFDAVGVAFDPTVHEALTMIPVADPAQDRRVVEQLQAGYMFGDRLLRAAKVVVGRHA